MPLSPKEIRDNALLFSCSWADVVRECAEAQSFLNEFFMIFGILRYHAGLLLAAGRNPVADCSMVLSTRLSPAICKVLKGEWRTSS